MLLLSPLLQLPLPLQLRTSHPECRKRTHTALACTRPAVQTHAWWETVMKIQTSRTNTTKVLSGLFSLPHTSNCTKRHYYYSTRVETSLTSPLSFLSRIPSAWIHSERHAARRRPHSTRWVWGFSALSTSLSVQEKSTVVFPVISPSSSCHITVSWVL